MDGDHLRLWLEDLPAGVAFEWSKRSADLESSYQGSERKDILARFAAMRARVLAVGLTDDEFGTPNALRRALAYFRGCERTQVLLAPANFGCASVGHFGLFHARRADFWQAGLSWLSGGGIPWPGETLPADAPGFD